MTEYCLLAISISFPLYVYGVRGIWLMLLAGFVCVGFAGLDEYHQSFVEARGPSVRDVGIDSCGAMIGILLVQAFCWSTLHTPNGTYIRIFLPYDVPFLLLLIVISQQAFYSHLHPVLFFVFLLRCVIQIFRKMRPLRN